MEIQDSQLVEPGVWIQLLRQEQFTNCGFNLPPFRFSPENEMTRNVSFGQLRVERLRPVDLFLRACYPSGFGRLNKISRPSISIGEARVRQGIIWIDLDRFLKKVDGRFRLSFSFVAISDLVEAVDSLHIK